MADGTTMERPARPASYVAAGQEHMRHQRWADAADAFGVVEAPDASVELQLNICRNLASVREHRPALYDILMSSAEPERYTIGTAGTGHPTIVYQTDSGTRISLSPGNEPVASLSSLFAAIKQNYQAGKAMAVLGMGDGYFLKACSLNPPAMAFESQQAVYLVEPDIQAVLACMTIHDYTGPRGPIEQRRFQWFVGDGCIAEARASLLGELFNPPPIFEVSQSPKSKEIGADLRIVFDELYQKYRGWQRENEAYYATVTREHLAALFGPNPPRQPRVLLVTTRCSTVLQYSTRDAAEGFRELGWDARVFIETEPYHTVTAPKVSQTLSEFKPDLVFQIDHLRSEWDKMYPPQLPFACWIQDHLPNLTNAVAGTTITARDYVLAAMPAMYVTRHGYPRRQCIDLSKLTRLPQRPMRWESDGDDLVYVSTASQQPAEVAKELASRYAHLTNVRTLVETACARMIEIYEAGKALSTQQMVHAMFDRVEASSGLRLERPHLRQEIVDALFDRMSNLLYRQQSLRWAVRIAGRRGLRLSIYGPGWERHPEFKAFARGKIQYGPELERLTRRSKINLVLEPFFSVSHQRLLDGLVAGGFFLIREHPGNTLFPELLHFLKSNVPDSVVSVEESRGALDGGKLAAFEELLQRCECLTGHGDLVALVRGAERSALLRGQTALPHLGEMSFDSAEALETRILRFLPDADARAAMAAAQRRDVEDRLSYVAGLRRAIGQIAERLNSEDAGRIL